MSSLKVKPCLLFTFLLTSVLGGTLQTPVVYYFYANVDRSIKNKLRPFEGYKHGLNNYKG